MVLECGYALCHDMIGLKRTIEAMVPFVSKGQVTEGLMELAVGEYLRERGDYSGSLESLERAVALVPGELRQYLCCVYSALAETHLAMESFEEAREVALHTIMLSEHEEGERLAYRARGHSILALAEAALGAPDTAIERLRPLIREVEAIRSPSLCTIVHEAAARIALANDDEPSFEHHLDRLELAARPTENPALIARGERLKNATSQRIDTPAREGDLVAMPTEITMVESWTWRRERLSEELSRIPGPGGRATRALEELLAATGAARGYLYLARDAGPELVAPLGGDEPSAELTEVVHAMLTGETDEREQSGEGRLLVPIVAGGTDDPAPIGVAVFVAGHVPLRGPDTALIELIAQSLRTTGHAVSGVRRAP